MSRRTTVGLGTLALLLAAGVGAESWYLWGTTSPVPSPQRPVVITDVAAIFSTTWRRYGAHLSSVQALMTPEMATRYRTTSSPVSSHVVSSRTNTTTRVAASGVVSADSDRVLALLFLDQRTTVGGAGPSYAARRALVTMVHTDDGWLVANVQTR